MASELQEWITISGTGSSKKKKSDEQAFKEAARHAESRSSVLEEWRSKYWKIDESDDEDHRPETPGAARDQEVENREDNGDLKQIEAQEILALCKSTWGEGKLEFNSFFDNEITITIHDNTVRDDLFGRLKTGTLDTNENIRTLWTQEDIRIQARIQNYWTLSNGVTDDYFLLKRKNADSSASSNGSSSSNSDDGSSDLSSSNDTSVKSREPRNDDAQKSTQQTGKNDLENNGSGKIQNGGEQEGKF